MNNEEIKIVFARHPVQCRYCGKTIHKKDCVAITVKKGPAFETEWECRAHWGDMG